MPLCMTSSLDKRGQVGLLLTLESDSGVSPPRNLGLVDLRQRRALQRIVQGSHLENYSPVRANICLCLVSTLVTETLLQVYLFIIFTTGRTLRLPCKAKRSCGVVVAVFKYREDVR